MKKNLIFILLLVSILGFLLNSCATIFSGTGQVINFNSNPQGAEVIVNGNSINQITPCHIELARKVKVSKYNLKNEYTYVFRKDGYNDVKVQDYRKINEIVWLNCATTVFALFTIPIDFITGAAYYYNGDINVELPKDEKGRDVIPPIISIVSPSVKRGFKHVVEENDLIILFH